MHIILKRRASNFNPSPSPPFIKSSTHLFQSVRNVAICMLHMINRRLENFIVRTAANHQFQVGVRQGFIVHEDGISSRVCIYIWTHVVKEGGSISLFNLPHLVHAKKYFLGDDLMVSYHAYIQLICTVYKEMRGITFDDSSAERNNVLSIIICIIIY